MDQPRIDSVVAIDIGSVNTQAVLIARVEGSFRFVARAQLPTTLEEPWSDVTIGVRHTVEQLSKIAARPLLSESGDLMTPERANGSGVDACLLTCSAAQPLHLVLAGLVGELSIDSLRRAAAGTYTWVDDVIALLGAQRLSDEARARRIMLLQPDLVCVSGGTDGGADTQVLDLVEAVTLGASLVTASARPKIVYAGNAALRARVHDLVGSQTELIVAEANVRPTLETEDLGPLQSELEMIHARTKIARVPGLATCAEWSKYPILSTARSIGHVVQYLSASGDRTRGALCVDAGASATTVAAAFNGQLHLTVRSDIGTAFGGARLLREVDAALISRWLPFELTSGELEAFVINKELHPASVPQETHDLLIEQALAREALHATLRAARPRWSATNNRSKTDSLPLMEPIIGSGAVLTRAPRPGQAALMLLDALEPVGITMLLLDVYGMMPALGAAAVAQPLCAVQAIDNGGLFPLGTVVAPTGRTRPGEVILGVKMSYESGGDLEVEVAAGTLEVLPLPQGQKATLRLQPRNRTIDIGRGPGRGASKVKVNGGAVGLIIDARGRPLASGPSADPARRRERMQQWLWDMGA